jgi:ribosomal protein L22
MTEQEAIETLQNTILKVGMANCKTIFGEAYVVAIKALRNEARRKELVAYKQEKIDQYNNADWEKSQWELKAQVCALKECEVE